MTDEKPKHKPQQKHTLSEVLKSLQDLIRTDIVSARTATKALPGGTAKREPPAAPTEPDTFNQALEKLDDIITHKIIEPVERARQTPPEPLLPDEVLEIEWDDAPLAEKAKPSKTVARKFPDAPVAKTFAVPDETIELQAIPSDLPDAESAPMADDTSELEIAEVEIAEPIQTEGAPVSDNPSEEIVELAAPPEEPGEQAVEEIEAITIEPIELEPTTATNDNVDKLEVPAVTQAEDAADVPTFMIEYTGSKPEIATIDLAAIAAPPAKPAPAKPAAPAQRPIKEKSSGTKPMASQPPAAARGPRAPDKPKPPTSSTPKKPLELVPDTLPVAPAEVATVILEAPKKPAQTKAKSPTAATPSPPQPSPPLKQEEIPILKEVAELDASPSTPLPDAAQARDIAIRVIARLNIERRKAGQAPLDIKTIERLQKYLAEALSKRALNKPK
jgi:hypothetical protein